MRQRRHQGVQALHPGQALIAPKAQLVTAAFQRDACFARQLVCIQRGQAIELDNDFIVGRDYRLHASVSRAQPQAGEVDQVLRGFRQRTEAVLELGDQAAELGIVLKRLKMLVEPQSHRIVEDVLGRDEGIQRDVE